MSQKFQSRYQTLKSEYNRLMVIAADRHWEEFIVPDQWLQDLRETSPGKLHLDMHGHQCEL